MKRGLVLGAFLGIVILSSCSKKKDGDPDIGPSKNGSALDLMRDSVFLYAKEAYYWNDGLPDYATFKPRSFTGSNDLDALTKEVNAISQYKINPSTGKAYEYYSPSPGESKYSFIDEGQVSDELDGIQGDFGFAPLYTQFDDNDLRIKYVYPGSPAGKAGIKRGDRVTTINGNSNISYDNGGPRTEFVVNAFFYSKNITLVLQRPDLTRFTVELAADKYTTNPVLTYKVFDTGNGRKVGYFVFNVFTSEKNAPPKLDQVFNYFSANGVTDLVVDLRYNGGGYVSTAEYLCNLIVPASKNNTMMYKTYYNNTLTTGRANLLANQVRRDPESGELYNYAELLNYLAVNNTENFSKKGSLNNIGKVFFIVGSGTASASELTINNLLPVLDVKLIGSTTYGKPVGFFDIKINKYEMYIPEFETKNSLTQGGYYNGMTPGSAQYPGQLAGDDITHDFGDPEETLLKYALNYVKIGTFSMPQKVQSTGEITTLSLKESAAAAKALDPGKFSGMIFDKPLHKK